MPYSAGGPSARLVDPSAFCPSECNYSGTSERKSRCSLLLLSSLRLCSPGKKFVLISEFSLLVVISDNKND